MLKKMIGVGVLLAATQFAVANPLVIKLCDDVTAVTTPNDLYSQVVAPFSDGVNWSALNSPKVYHEQCVTLGPVYDLPNGAYATLQLNDAGGQATIHYENQNGGELMFKNLPRSLQYSTINSTTSNSFEVHIKGSY